MAISAAEQYAIELVNRARLNPVAEAKRFGIGLNDGIADGTISNAAKQVLAPHQALDGQPNRMASGFWIRIRFRIPALVAAAPETGSNGRAIHLSVAAAAGEKTCR